MWSMMETEVRLMEDTCETLHYKDVTRKYYENKFTNFFCQPCDIKRALCYLSILTDAIFLN